MTNPSTAPDHAAKPAGHHHHVHCDHAAPAEAGTTVLDPVCGMRVDPASSRHHTEHDGQTVHFCSAGCRTKFIAVDFRAELTRFFHRDLTRVNLWLEGQTAVKLWFSPFFPSSRQCWP